VTGPANSPDFPFNRNTTHVSVDNTRIGHAGGYNMGDHLGVSFSCFETGTLVANITFTDPMTHQYTSIFWAKACVTYPASIFLVDPGNLGMIAIAVFLVAWGAIRADTPFVRRVQEAAGGSTQIQWQGAVAFVIGASISLLLIFYFLKQMQVLLTITISFAATTALTMLVYSLIHQPLGSKFPSLMNVWAVPWFGDVSTMEAISLFAALVVIVSWFITHHWVANNIIGASLCLYMLSMLQLPSIKVSALLLTLLFFYDIFWVFYSPRVFGKSVMVAAATGLDLPIKLILPRILTPCLSRNMTMLGLGDIALPGLLVAYTRRFDSWKHSRTRRFGYFHICTTGYAVGMCICFFVLFVFKTAQPALLYLVPCTLGPVCIAGWFNEDLAELWVGISYSELAETQAPDEEQGIGDTEAEELLAVNEEEENPVSAGKHQMSVGAIEEKTLLTESPVSAEVMTKEDVLDDGQSEL